MIDSRKKAKCTTCKNENCLIKKHIDSESLKEYLEEKHTINCRESQQFILEGAPVYGIYFVYDGVVKVSKTVGEDRDQIIRFSKNGEVVGHRGYGTDYVYNVSASTLKETVLCNFSTEIFNKMLFASPALMYDFMLFYADQLQKSETNSRKFNMMTIREKVISALLLIQDKFGEKGGFLNLVLSRNDIAEFAGTTEEQVIKVISSLKKHKLINTKGKQIGLEAKQLKKEISAYKMIEAS